MNVDPTTQAILLTVLGAYAGFCAQKGITVFHDGVRPMFGELTSKRMSHYQFGLVDFSLSFGFIVGWGLPLSLATGIMSAGLLFLGAETVGVFAPTWWAGLAFGAGWSLICQFAVYSIQALATILPVDFISPMAAFAAPILSIFQFFPTAAIGYAFGWKAGVASFAVVAFLRQILAILVPQVSTLATTIGIGMVILVALAINKDFFAKKGEGEKKKAIGAEKLVSVFTENTRRIRSNIIFIVAMAALIATVCSFNIFAMSEAGIFFLKAGDPMAAGNGEFFRYLGFTALLIMTSLASGTYAIFGLVVPYMSIGMWLQNPLMAAPIAAGVAAVEVLALDMIGKGLQRIPTMRAASDHIRASIFLTIEVALLFGALTAGNAMAGDLGLFLIGGIYCLNEATGRKIMRITIPTVAFLVSGVLLNILFFLGL